MPTRSRVRMSPDERREQLLDLGASLFARRNVDDLSIDELADAAGVSRGLLYHYFGGKQEFRDAVVRRAAEGFVAATAPREDQDPLERLNLSVQAYVDWVDANYEGYLSLVRAAAGGDPAMRSVYDDARTALTDRILDLGVVDLVPDPDVARMLVRGWQAMAEEIVLAWKEPDSGIDRDQVIGILADSIPGLLAAFIAPL